MAGDQQSRYPIIQATGGQARQFYLGHKERGNAPSRGKNSPQARLPSKFDTIHLRTSMYFGFCSYHPRNFITIGSIGSVVRVASLICRFRSSMHRPKWKNAIAFLHEMPGQGSPMECQVRRGGGPCWGGREGGLHQHRPHPPLKLLGGAPAFKVLKSM